MTNDTIDFDKHPVYPSCIKNVLSGVKGERCKDAMFSLAYYFKQKDIEQEFALQKILEVNKNNNPLLLDSEIKSCVEEAYSNDGTVDCLDWRDMSMCPFNRLYECSFFRSKKPFYNKQTGILFLSIYDDAMTISKEEKGYVYQIYHGGKSRSKIKEKARLWERQTPQSNLMQWLGTWYKPESINDILIKNRSQHPKTWDEFLEGGIIDLIKENIEYIKNIQEEPFDFWDIKIKGGRKFRIRTDELVSSLKFRLYWFGCSPTGDIAMLPYDLSRNDYRNLLMFICDKAETVYSEPETFTMEEHAGSKFITQLKERSIMYAEEKNILDNSRGRTIFLDDGFCKSKFVDEKGKPRIDNNSKILLVPSENVKKFCEKEYADKITPEKLSRQVTDYKLKDKDGKAYPSQKAYLGNGYVRFWLFDAEKCGVDETMVMPDDEEET